MHALEENFESFLSFWQFQTCIGRVMFFLNAMGTGQEERQRSQHMAVQQHTLSKEQHAHRMEY
jgi:hypothetical protein